MGILITICARGGSKGIPGKNIRLLNGIPLIAYTIQIAKRFAEIYNADIAISTDDDEIGTVAKNYGIVTDYKRPLELAGDKAGKIDTIRHLLLHQEKFTSQSYDYVLDLDVTSPLRTLNDLIEAYEMIKKDDLAVNLFSVNEASRNPYFNMVEEKANGYYDLVKKGENILSRQTAPKVYELNASFYFYKRDFFDMGLRTIFTAQSLIYLVPHLCFDLDHITDFEFLEYLLKNTKLDFPIWMY